MVSAITNRISYEAHYASEAELKVKIYDLKYNMATFFFFFEVQHNLGN